MLDFNRLRSGPDGWRGSFEALVRQLGRVTPAPHGAEFRHIHGAGGDGGIEAYWIMQNGDELGYQAKFHTSVRDIDWAALDKSIKTALATHPRLTAIQVAIACDLTDRVAGRNGRTGWEQWDAHRKRWEAHAAAGSRVVEFKFWGASDLEELLTAPTAAGLREYWFGEVELSGKWFRDQFARTVDALDERFHPEDHVDVQVGEVFGGLSRSPDWRARLTRLHAAIMETDLLRPNPASPEVAQSYDEIEDSVLSLRRKEDDPGLPVETPFPHAGWRHEVQRLRAGVYKAYDRLRFSARAGAESRLETATDTAARARHQLSVLDEAADELLRTLDEPQQEADEKRYVIVTGRAGSGKSHLLASEVQAALDAGEPAIMLLGSDFMGSEPPSLQLLRRFGLERSTLDVFLGMLSAAAEIRGARALIVIDALNEGAGARFWRERLVAFAASVLAHERVALCVSCRTEFADYLITDGARRAACAVTVPGFVFPEEQERAAQVYMDRRGILRPSIPWLSPEFGNPLFLRTTCQALQRNGRREFPRGLRGTRARCSPSTSRRRAGIWVRDTTAATSFSRRFAGRCSAWPTGWRTTERISSTGNRPLRSSIRSSPHSGLPRATPGLISSGSMASFVWIRIPGP